MVELRSVIQKLIDNASLNIDKELNDDNTFTEDELSFLFLEKAFVNNSIKKSVLRLLNKNLNKFDTSFPKENNVPTCELNKNSIAITVRYKQKSGVERNVRMTFVQDLFLPELIEEFNLEWL